MEENILTTKPIPALIRQIAIPASIGFFFNTMYNVVDTYYGSMISTQAVAAMSLSFPVFFVIIAMGSGISTGTNALISHAQGKGKQDEAKKYLSQTIVITVLISIILTILSWIDGTFLATLLGASGENVTMT